MKSVQIDKEVWRELKIRSAKKDRSMTEMATKALRRYLKDADS